MKTTIEHVRIISNDPDPGGFLRLELVALYDVRDNRHMALNVWQCYTVTFESADPKPRWGSCVSNGDDCKASAP